MTDAPERIWVDDERHIGGAVHVESERTKFVAKYSVEYVRADLVAALEAENQRLREALRPFGDAADHAIKSVGKTTTLGVLGALAPYFVTWQDFNRARAALRSTEASHD